VDGDTWPRRAELLACRVRDDDWLFERFAQLGSEPTNIDTKERHS
jgi:hypothetical protein